MVVTPVRAMRPQESVYRFFQSVELTLEVVNRHYRRIAVDGHVTGAYVFA
jgi:hypothetical protein